MFAPEKPEGQQCVLTGSSHLLKAAVDRDAMMTSKTRLISMAHSFLENFPMPVPNTRHRLLVD